MECETSLPRPKTSSLPVTNSVLLHVVLSSCVFHPITRDRHRVDLPRVVRPLHGRVPGSSGKVPRRRLHRGGRARRDAGGPGPHPLCGGHHPRGDAPLPSPRTHRAPLHVRGDQDAKARFHNLFVLHRLKMPKSFCVHLTFISLLQLKNLK